MTSDHWVRDSGANASAKQPRRKGRFSFCVEHEHRSPSSSHVENPGGARAVSRLRESKVRKPSYGRRRYEVAPRSGCVVNPRGNGPQTDGIDGGKPVAELHCIAELGLIYETGSQSAITCRGEKSSRRQRCS
jgi:hypothetical protein